MKIVISWILYYLGDLASKVFVLRDTEGWVNFWYPVYNNLMLLSVKIQGNSDKGPWEKVKDTE